MRGRSRSPVSRFFVAMAAYLVGSLAIEYALLLANAGFHLHLERGQTLLPPSFPVFGNMSWYSLIYVVALVGLIWLLYQTGVMPRDLFGRRPMRRPAEWDSYTLDSHDPHDPPDTARQQDEERIL
jgi:hypothetical protein